MATSQYWRGKVTVVAGGSAGFGREIVRELASRGARVLVVAREEGRLRDSVEAIREEYADVVACPGDVTRDDDVARIVETVSAHGELHAWFQAAGRSDRGEALGTPVDRFRELFELNTLAAIRCAQAAAHRLRASRGHLVLVGSLASKSASRFLGAYAVSKFPLAAFAQQLRLEVPRDELHVLLVCPGPLARDDGGRRYDQVAEGLPEAARRPGAGVRLAGIDPRRLAGRVLDACERRRAEMVVPAKARLLFALAQLSPRWGDWLLSRMTR